MNAKVSAMPAASRHDTLGAQPSYLPTSLDFLTRPNPVEPDALRDKHFWGGSGQLSEHIAPSSQNVFGHILHSAPLVEDAPLQGPREEPAKPDQSNRRRKAENDISLDLPRLPERQSQKRPRPRLPPTISGLHQPPPDAGLLPRINVEAPPQSQQDLTNSAGEDHTSSSDRLDTTVNGPAGQADLTQSNKAYKRNKWSDEETADLLKGVAIFGIGNWTKILRHKELHFNRRTALDLKDKFRVVCPSQYCPPRHSKIGKKSKLGTRNMADSRLNATVARPVVAVNGSSSRPSSKLLSSQELQNFVVGAAFDKKQRRSRHGYSEVEDCALLEGFQKYHTKWKKIRDDPELRLSHRQPTDLRDRMRTRYPEEYAKTGRVSTMKIPDAARRPQAVSSDANLENKESNSTTKLELIKPVPSSTETRDAEAPARPPQPRATKPNTLPTRSNLPQIYDLFPPSDVFFGAGFDAEDQGDNQLITLDRDILSFANLDAGEKHPATLAEHSRSGLGVIDPQETLLGPGLPPQAYASVTTIAGAVMPLSTTSLPSFSTLMPPRASEVRLEAEQQIGLPSMQWNDTESRQSQTVPNLDELG